MVNYLLPSHSELMLKLSSNPRNIARVEAFVERIAHKYQIAPDLYGNILISLTEAVNNAIVHGNERDESKTVEVILQEAEDTIALRVRDEGRGFDFANLPDPTQPENLTKIGGRGVFLMHQLSDGVDYQDAGNTVEMRFRLNQQR